LNPSEHVCALHSVAFLPADQKPMGHSVQPSDSLLAPVLEEYCPAGQFIGLHDSTSAP